MRLTPKDAWEPLLFRGERNKDDLQIVHQSDFRGEFPSRSGGAAPPATLRIAAARLCDAIPHRAVRLLVPPGAVGDDRRSVPNGAATGQHA